VLFVSDWYTSLTDWIREQETNGFHAGLADTSLLLAVAPEHVRSERLAAGRGIDIDGVQGDPTGASIELGQFGMDVAHEAAMSQIRQLLTDN
jgi:creatinine amidohydrolase